MGPAALELLQSVPKNSDFGAILQLETKLVACGPGHPASKELPFKEGDLAERLLILQRAEASAAELEKLKVTVDHVITSSLNKVIFEVLSFIRWIFREEIDQRLCE